MKFLEKESFYFYGKLVKRVRNSWFSCKACCFFKLCTPVSKFVTYRKDFLRMCDKLYYYEEI